LKQEFDQKAKSMTFGILFKRDKTWLTQMGPQSRFARDSQASKQEVNIGEAFFAHVIMLNLEQVN